MSSPESDAADLPPGAGAETRDAETQEVAAPDAPEPPRSLRSQIRRRLVKHERERDDPRLLLPGERYRYVRELGRGGMGAVLEAEDQKLGRAVAVKTVLGDEPSRLARFRREARLASQLEHPHIVPVYGLDEREDGGASLTMRKVEGQSLGQVIQRFAQEGDDPERGQAWLLEVVTAVAQAVAYAHAQGVIHRDIKPDNVMLGRFGQVFLTDFGLAKRLDSSDSEEELAAVGDGESAGESFVSQDGSVVGTPAYMAPEQAGGRQDQVDAQTDVYMLGALLYELLTLTRPFAGQRGKALLEAIQLAEPEPPRERAPRRRIPRELGAIALKALAKDKQQRYPSADALLADLRAFQEGRSVSACRDSWGVRIAKWAGRHRLLVATGATALGVALAGGVTLAVWRDQVRGEELAALQRRQAASAPYLTGIDLLRRRLDVATITSRAIPALEQALALDPGFAEARFALGQAYLRGNRADRAREQMLVALEVQPHNAHWLVQLGQAYHYSLDPRHPEAAAARAEARRYFERASAVGRGATPFAAVGEAMVLVEDGHPAEARALLETTAERAPHLWEVWHALGYVRLRSGPEQLEGAEQAFRRAVAMEPDDARTVRGLAAALLAQERFADALTYAERAAELGDPGLALDLTNLGHALFRLERYAEALDVLERALARQPGDVKALITKASTLSSLARPADALAALELAARHDDGSAGPVLQQNRGSALMALLRYDEALEAYEQARALAPDSADSWANVAFARIALGQLDAARADLRRAVELDPDLPQVWTNLAGLEEAAGNLAAAEAIVSEGLEHVQDVGRLWMIRGMFRLQRGAAQEALPDLERALELGGSPGAPLPDVMFIFLSRAYRLTGQPQRALDLLEARGDALPEAQQGLRRNEAGIAHFQVAQALAQAGDLEGCRPHLARSFELEPQSGNALMAADVEAQLGDLDQAFVWLERAYAQGWRDGGRLRSPALEPLRGDPRWQAWVDKLAR